MRSAEIKMFVIVFLGVAAAMAADKRGYIP